MCHRVTCSTCGKPTYAGCGRHIEAVLADVRPEDRCSCREQRPNSSGKRDLAERLAALFGTKRRT